jgi:hypothetical protein
MAQLYALVSAGGAPGVTTAALALALTWPSPVIVAECDPSGGDILAGLLGGRVPARQGLMEHAIEAGHGPHAAGAILASQLVPLDADGRQLLLPGITDPRQATGLASAWPALAAALAAQHADVIADCGRLDAGDGQPLPVLLAARHVAVVLRPSLRQVWAARSRVDMLTRLLGGTERLTLLLTGPGPHSAREIADALGVPVAARLADDARTAAVLSDGAGGRRKLVAGQLIRTARTAGHTIRGHGQAAPSLPAEAGARR